MSAIVSTLLHCKSEPENLYLAVGIFQLSCPIAEKCVLPVSAATLDFFTTILLNRWVTW
jgi:hypothetical protein